MLPIDNINGVNSITVCALMNIDIFFQGYTIKCYSI